MGRIWFVISIEKMIKPLEHTEMQKSEALKDLLDEFVKQFKEAEDTEVETNEGDDEAKDEDSKHFNFK